MDQQDPGFPGPFQYGVAPAGSLAIGPANPANLVPGQKYSITVTGILGGQPAVTGFDFIP